VPAAYTTPGGTLFYELWSTDATPAPIGAGPIGAGQNDQAPPAPVPVPPARNGTQLRINELPPGACSPMHRTQTVDYGIVLDGEVVLVLDDSDTVLRAGDVVVQRGTNHRWENRSGTTARVAFVLIDGAFTPGLLGTLGGDGPGGPS
jgi:quercetin dioxygenase-like cupin family protein